MCIRARDCPPRQRLNKNQLAGRAHPRGWLFNPHPLLHSSQLLTKSAMSRSPLIEIPVSPFLTPVESPVAKPSLKRPLTPGETVLSPSKRRILVAEGILQPDFKAKRSARGNTHETKSRTMPGIVGVLLESPDIVTRPKAGASSSSTSRTTSPRSHTSKPYGELCLSVLGRQPRP